LKSLKLECKNFFDYLLLFAAALAILLLVEPDLGIREDLVVDATEGAPVLRIPEFF